LHSGKLAHITLCPAPAGTGIRFHRTDIGSEAFVDAVAGNVSSTARSTTISNGKVSVSTIEHLLSAFTGLGIDNAIVRVDAPELPILDGSAIAFAEAISRDGFRELDAERQWIELKEEILVEDKPSGAYIKLIPASEPSFDLTIDFNSRVLGVQTFHFDFSLDYVSEVAPCRTFCFLHEIQRLLTFGLVKGGDIENAIIVVEKPVSDRQLRNLAKTFGQPLVSVTPQGYLSNLELRFPDECCRHKMLDLLGDLRLAGGFIKAKVIAYKPGHRLNTVTTKKLLDNLK